MRLAFVFPGGGSQYLGMGRDLSSHPAAREVFARADQALGFSLSRLCFEGPAEELDLQQSYSPAILTHSIAALRVLEAELGLRPEIVAGHSLGEYSALVCAGALGLEAAVRLVRLRGQLMQEASPGRRGAMAAVSGTPLARVEELCRRAALAGEILTVATQNGAGQMVIGGDAVAVERALGMARRFGVRRCARLKISVASHTALMAAAARGLAAELARTELGELSIPILTNVEATPLLDSRRLPELLARQLTSTVRWEASIRQLVALGVEEVIEIGPGDVLARLVRSIAPSLLTRSVDGLRSLRLLGGEPEELPAASPALIGRVLAIWREALGGGEPRSGDRFGELGGDSLAAARVVSRIARVFGIELPARRVLEADDASQLAARVEQALAERLQRAPEEALRLRRVLELPESAGPARIAEALAAHPSELGPSLPRLDRELPLALSFAQQRLWFLDQLEGTLAYHLPAAHRIRGALDPSLLERALTALAARHEPLRTRFRAEEGQPSQVILPPGPVPLPLVDLSSLPAPERDPALAERIRDERRRPFRLDAELPFRALLFRLAPEDHLLLLTVHHIAADGLSLVMIDEELGELYAAERADRAPRLAPLPVQYADFAAWQRGWLRGDRLELELAYWSERLADAVDLELPTDRPRPRMPSGRGGALPLHLPADRVAALRALGAGEDATLFMVLCAGLATLLARYTGQRDLCIGSPVAGRPHPEVERLVGFFVNDLVLRVDLHGDPSFRQLLQRVRRVCLEAYEHQELPFEKLVEELQPERELSRTPFFQVMLGLRSVPDALELPGLEVEPAWVERETSSFDLGFMFEEDAHGLGGRVDYSSDLFDRSTVERIQRHLFALLEAALVDPDRRVAELPLLSEAELRQLLHDWNDTRLELPRDQTIVELIAAQARATPAAPAARCGGEALSYAELDARVEALARELAARGVGPEVLVGVYLERSLTMLVALLAVHRAGGAYLPLDPDFPQQRLGFVAEDAGLRLVLSAGGLACGFLEEKGCVILRLDRARAPAGPEPAPLPRARGEDLAYVLYTSGSTGRPKGVQIRHDALASFRHAICGQAPGLTARDRLLAVTTISFDISVLELLLPLSVGAEVVIADRETAADGRRLRELLEGCGATVLQATPASWRMLLAAGWPGGPGRARGLKLLCGGEALPPELARELLATGAELWNLYGPTETTVWSAIEEVREVGEAAEVLPIGRPIANTRLHVLDGERRLLPVGVVGELYIGGVGLARGYLGRPELTAERFVADPFLAGERLYRTGDLARRLPDGRIEYRGRIDNQVKVRGFRIELGEIEARLLEHPAVAAAAVVVREDAPGDRRVVGYVVARGALAPGALREHLAARLPDYMVPAPILLLEALPLTPNGKLDRRALPAPDASRSPAAGGAPRSSTEEVVASLFAEVLRTGQVGIHDSFFDLGGHSLLAAQLLARLTRVFDLRLELRSLFTSPTVAALSLEIDRLAGERRGGGGAGPPPIPIARREGRLPASFAQQRLWSSPYHLQRQFRLRGPLQTAALRQALLEIVRRHEVLRTVYLEAEGQPWQVVRPTAELALLEAALPEGDAGEAERRRLARLDLTTRFALDADPPLRVRLLRASSEEHVLLLTIHHIAIDGWGLGVLYRELAALYGELAAGRAPSLPPLPVQVVDFALWQRSWLAGEELERQLAHFRGQLADAPTTLRLPVDRLHPESPSTRGAELPVALEPQLIDALRSLARAEGATLFMALLAGLGTVLGRLAGQLEVTIGSPIANRAREELEPLIGFFANTLVLRVDRRGDPSFRELLRRVREACLGAYAHQDLPFERLLEDLRPARPRGRSPLFQVLFALQNGPADALALPGLGVEELSSELQSAPYELSLFVREAPEGLRGRLGYASDLFDEATVARLISCLEVLLRGAVAEPDLALSALPLRAEDAAPTSPLIESPLLLSGIALEEAIAAIAASAARVPFQPLASPILAGAGLTLATSPAALEAALARGELPEADLYLVLGEPLADEVLGLLEARRPGLRVIGLCGPAFSPAALLSDSAYGRALHPFATLVRPLSPATVLEPGGVAAPIGLSGELALREGEGWRRTGISARRVEGGFELLAWLDESAWLESCWISLREVERTLAGHPELSAALAAVPPAGDELVLAAVPAEAAAPDPELLLRWLRQRLPLPRATRLRLREGLPLTPEGRPDRRGLAAGEDEERIVVTASFTSEPVEHALRFWCRELGLDARIVFAPYHQVLQQLLDQGSALSANRRGANLVLLRLLDWLGLRDETGEPIDRVSRIAEASSELRAGFAAAAPRLGVPTVVVLCPGDTRGCAEVAEALQDAEAELAAAISGLPQLSLVTAAELAAAYPWEAPFDPHGDALGHVPFVPQVFTAIGTIAARRIAARRRRPYKVIALDCDQTLWSGVVGEDGPLGVRVDGPRQALQRAMLRQQEAGKLLCLCTKNTPEDVLAVFDEHPGMLLRREHLAAWRASWQPKAESLRELAAELNLGLDSFIFIDDNPVECAAVEEACPEVLVLQLPEAAEEIPRLLESLWALDLTAVTEADRERTALYRVETRREQLRRSAPSLADYIAGLELEVQVAPPTEEQLPRLAQLTLRTNQFNATSLRRDEPALRRLLEEGTRGLAVTVRDRFGDYGLVGLVLYRELADRLEVESLLLSCRVLGRGVEHRVLAALGELARAAGKGELVLLYRRTPKNQPVRDFLESVASAEGSPEQALYRLSAEAAAAIRYAPPTTSAAPSPSAALASRSGPGFDQRLARSALALSELEAIHRAVERARRERARPRRAGFAPPRTPEEILVCQTFAEVFGVPEIGISDDFFDLGGHSLLATQVVSRLREQLRRDLPLQLVFEHPTVAELAAALSEVTAGATLAMDRADRDGPVPLSLTQEGYWLLEELQVGNRYRPAFWRLRGPLHPLALRRALTEVVRRHEVLRCALVSRQGRPVAELHPELEVALPILDLGGLPRAEQRRAALAVFEEEAGTELALSRPPLLRARLVRLGPEEHLLTVVIHHIVSDAVAWRVLRDELAAIYPALVAGRPSPLPPLRWQYSDFAASQRRWLGGERRDAEIAHWRERLRDAAPLAIPTDWPRGERRTLRLDAVPVEVPRALRDGLSALAKASGGSLFGALLAALELVLARHAGQDDVSVSVPVSGRTRIEVESLIGLFVNIVVVRGDLSGSPSFREVLRRVQQSWWEAWEHQALPQPLLWEALRPTPGAAPHPLANPVAFLFQDYQAGEWRLAEELGVEPALADDELHALELGIMRKSCDFELALSELADGLRGFWRYSVDLFERETVERIRDDLLRLLVAVVSDPDRPVSELPLLGPLPRTDLSSADRKREALRELLSRKGPPR